MNIPEKNLELERDRMRFKVAVLHGDGVGPEVAAEGIKVLEQIGRKFGHEFDLKYGDIGGISIDNYGVALAPEVLKMCRKCDAVYLGAVGGPKWDDPLAKVRPENGLLALRKELKLFANLRPVKVFPELYAEVETKLNHILVETIHQKEGLKRLKGGK